MTKIFVINLIFSTKLLERIIQTNESSDLNRTFSEKKTIFKFGHQHFSTNFER